MNTLIYTSILGLLCMIAEVMNLRKLLIPLVVLGLASIFYVNFSDWGFTGEITLSGINMSHMMKTDHFSVAFTGLAIFLTLLLMIMAGEYYRSEEHHLSDYLSIMVFILCGIEVLFSFNNMAMLFLGIEIVSISLYIMAGSRRFDVRSNEAGFKYFIMGSFASGFLLFGIALVFGASGSFEIDKIADYATQNNKSMMFFVGVMLMMMAMLFKVAAVPFHYWSPDVYEGSPALVTAMMATLVKVSVFGAFYRLMSAGFFGVYNYTGPILVIVVAASVILGNFTALHQTSFKRLLAYSGIAHAGYMLMTLLSIPTQASSALFFYGAAYSIGSIGVFAIAIPVFAARRKEDIGAFNGLGKSHPMLAGLLTIGMLSLAGIPPFAGFLAKYYVFSEAFRNGFMTLTMIAIITSAVSAYYYLKVVLAMYTKDPIEGDVQPGPMYWLVILVATMLTIVLGLFPGVLTHLLY